MQTNMLDLLWLCFFPFGASRPIPGGGLPPPPDPPVLSRRAPAPPGLPRTLPEVNHQNQLTRTYVLLTFYFRAPQMQNLRVTYEFAQNS